MKKFALLLLLIAILVGCQQQTATPTAQAGQFVGGSEGLAISFVQGAPPAEIVDRGQPFGISVLVENKGDDTVAAGEYSIALTGIDPALFGASPSAMIQRPSEELTSARIDSAGTRLLGAKVTADFPQGSSFQHTQEIAGTVSYTVKADICYQYTAKANTKLCILSDILGTDGRTDKLCNVNEAKQVDASGAPLKVESFVESVASSNSVAFVFKVRHTGAGSVHKLASGCSDEFSQKDRVRVTINTNVPGTISCSGMTGGTASGSTYTGEVQLLNGEREIRCTQTVSNPSDFESLVSINVDYDYRNSATTQLRVRHIG